MLYGDRSGQRYYPSTGREGPTLLRCVHELPAQQSSGQYHTKFYTQCTNVNIGKQSNQLGNQFKPAILQCFGDIAQAILGAFETYLAVVAQVLQQASSVSMTTEGNYEMIDYITSLREGIMDAWDGIIVAMKSSGKSTSPPPFRTASANHHSPTARSISGFHLRAPSHRTARQQSYRGTSPLVVWRHWVR